MTEFDPTTNRIPFGLLSEDEQTALKDWPHGWEIWWDGDRDNWGNLTYPNWEESPVYRGKSAPVVIKRFAAIYPRGSTGSWRDTIHDVTKISGANMIGIIQLDITDGVPSTKILEVKK
jgi:hypothetical protein